MNSQPPPTPLSRGGLWLMTPLGALQLGAPPETLKDTLAQQDAVKSRAAFIQRPRFLSKSGWTISIQ